MNAEREPDTCQVSFRLKTHVRIDRFKRERSLSPIATSAEEKTDLRYSRHLSRRKKATRAWNALFKRMHRRCQCLCGDFRLTQRRNIFSKEEQELLDAYWIESLCKNANLWNHATNKSRTLQMNLSAEDESISKINGTMKSLPRCELCMNSCASLEQGNRTSIFMFKRSSGD